jgi:enoyl-CoA hydratase/carnithine racemase
LDSSAPDFYIAHFNIVIPVLQDYVDGIWSNLTLLVNLPVLTIAVVQGIARGCGAEFAAALDIKFLSKEKANFGQIEVAYGQLPGGGGMSLLPRLVGRSRALEIVLGAEDFDTDTAAQYGCKALIVSINPFAETRDQGSIAPFRTESSKSSLILMRTGLQASTSLE